MKKTTLVALLLACITTPALADNSDKIYLALDLGRAVYDNVTMPASGGSSSATFPNPGVIHFAAGYQITPEWAAEFGYSRLSSSSINYSGQGTVKLETHSFQGAVIRSLPLSDYFSLTGKIGFSSNYESLSGNGIYSSLNSNDANTDWLLGVGAQVNINDSNSMRIQYERYGKFDSYPNPIKAKVISFGYLYSFQ